jgi:hypothetical protein
VFHTDVIKVDQDAVDVTMVVHVCCKSMSLMFHLFFLDICCKRVYLMLLCFHIYVESILSECCIYLQWVLSVFKYFCKYFRYMFQVFHPPFLYIYCKRCI